MNVMKTWAKPAVYMLSILVLSSCLARIPVGEDPEEGYYQNEPEVYKKDYDTVWDATVKAAEELDWKIKQKDKSSGKISFSPSYVYNARYKIPRRIYNEPSIDDADNSRTMSYLKSISYFEKATPKEAPPHPVYIREYLTVNVNDKSDDKTSVKADYKIVPYFDYKIGHLGTVRSRGVLEKGLYSRISEILSREKIAPPIPPPPSPSMEEVYQLSDIFFDFDRAEIRPDAIPVLLENIEQIKKEPELNIVIQGYADIRGTDEYNKRLAKRRADATKRFLIRHGINHRRITAISEGETFRFATGTTEEEYQLNRRSHFIPFVVEDGNQ